MLSSNVRPLSFLIPTAGTRIFAIRMNSEHLMQLSKDQSLCLLYPRLIISVDSSVLKAEEGNLGNVNKKCLELCELWT